MLIAARNGFLVGNRLPYDAEVEYLESTGTQWIDTGILANSNLRVECLFKMLETPTTYKWIFAARSVDVGGNGFCFGGNNLGYAISDYNGRVISNILLTNGSVYEVVKDANVCRINDTSIENIATTFTQDKTLPIFGIVLANGTLDASSIPKCALYHFRIYAGATLVRDFIPVRVGTVGYLYDRVSGKLFGNQGSGDFVLGPDVVPVEYIQSHGTEYIDTGKYPANVGRWELTIQYTSLSQIANNDMLNGVFGAPNQRFDIGWNLANDAWYLNLGALQSVGTRDLDVHKFALDNIKGAVLVDELEISVPLVTFSTTNYPILIANRGYYGSSTNYFCKEKIFSSAMYDYNNTLVRSFRPVRVGTEGAMMDVLTRRIYRNAGTGAFGYGNDLNYPIPAE